MRILTLSSVDFSSCLSWSLTFEAWDFRETIFEAGTSWRLAVDSSNIIISSTGMNHFNSNVYFSVLPDDYNRRNVNHLKNWTQNFFEEFCSPYTSHKLSHHWTKINAAIFYDYLQIQLWMSFWLVFFELYQPTEKKIINCWSKRISNWRLTGNIDLVWIILNWSKNLCVICKASVRVLWSGCFWWTYFNISCRTRAFFCTRATGLWSKSSRDTGWPDNCLQVMFFVISLNWELLALHFLTVSIARP